MAESTLSLGYVQLQREIGRFLGWDRDSSNWSSDQLIDFGDVLAAGLRYFYFPPAIIEGEPPHEWSFLKPTTTLSITNGDFQYDLPDSFSGVIGDDSLTLGVASGEVRLTKITEDELRALQAGDNQSATPLYYAIRPKAHAPQTGHRYEILFYPTPDGSYTASYRYVIVPDVVDDTNVYPVGGAAYAECMLQAVLAAAEEKMDDDMNGIHHQRFLECLGAAIRLDREHRSVSLRL